MSKQLGTLLNIPFLVIGKGELTEEEFADFLFDTSSIEEAISTYLLQRIPTENMLLIYNNDLPYYMTLIVYKGFNLPVVTMITLKNKLKNILENTVKKLFGFDVKHSSGCPIRTYKDFFKKFCITTISVKLQRHNKSPICNSLRYAYFSIDYSIMFNDYILYFIVPSNHNYCFVILPEDAYSKNIAMGYNFGVDLDSLDSLFGDITDEELDKKVDETIKEIIPKNNDGREHCFWCGRKTKKIDSGMYSKYDYCEGCKK